MRKLLLFFLIVSVAKQYSCPCRRLIGRSTLSFHVSVRVFFFAPSRRASPRACISVPRPNSVRWSPPRCYWRAPSPPPPAPATCRPSTSGICSGTTFRSTTPTPTRTNQKWQLPLESKSVSVEYKYFFFSRNTCRYF